MHSLRRRGGRASIRFIRTPNFQRGKDQKIVAKVLVTCELTIFGLGSHSATGEEWADDENAGTSAEAQAFKRACWCFGLGRYLYYFQGIWVDLDQRKRPKAFLSFRDGQLRQAGFKAFDRIVSYSLMESRLW
jgi:hypothetical protein